MSDPKQPNPQAGFLGRFLREREARGGGPAPTPGIAAVEPSPPSQPPPAPEPLPHDPDAPEAPLTLPGVAIEPLEAYTAIRKGAPPPPRSSTSRPGEPRLVAAAPTLSDDAIDALFFGGGVAERPGVEMLGRYELLGELGRGGMSEVFRVRDPALKRAMAMKVIKTKLAGSAENLARLVEEAQATAQLQHPGVVSVHELGRLPDGRIYFTMEEIRGFTLKRVLYAFHKRPMAEREALRGRGVTLWRLLEVFRKICDAVAYAHSRGVLHRDLKPSNVMLGDFGAVYVVDWGIAKVIDDPERAESLDVDHLHATVQGTVLGTLNYMAPEQAAGRLDLLGPWTDVYSLGVILFEICTGIRPTAGARDPLLNGEIRPGMPRIPRGIAPIIREALAKNGFERFQDAGGLGAALEGWMVERGA